MYWMFHLERQTRYTSKLNQITHLLMDLRVRGFKIEKKHSTEVIDKT